MLLQLPTAAVSSPPTPSSTDWLVCAGLCLRRRGRDLLDRVNLHCRTGEWLALVDPVGDSGAALFALIEGRDRPDAGSLRWPAGRGFACASVVGGLRWPPGLTPRQLCAALGWVATSEQFAVYGLERRLDWQLADLAPLESRLLQLLFASAIGARTLLLDDPLRDLDSSACATFIGAVAAQRQRWPQALWRVPDFEGLQGCCERRIDLDRGRVCVDRRVAVDGVARTGPRYLRGPDAAREVQRPAPVPQRFLMARSR